MSDNQDNDKNKRPLPIPTKREAEPYIPPPPRAINAKTKIDSLFNEILFKLWISGKSFQEITDMYSGTEREFSINTLIHASKRYLWAKRKAKIIEDIRENTDDTIQVFLTEKLKMVHLILSVTSDEIAKEYQKYIEGGVKKPSWIPTSVKEIDTLMRLHDFLVSGGAEKHLVGVKGVNSLPVQDIVINDDNAVKILELLANEATNEFTDMDAISEEAVSAAKDDRKNWRVVKGFQKYKDKNDEQDSEDIIENNLEEIDE